MKSFQEIKQSNAEVKFHLHNRLGKGLSVIARVAFAPGEFIGLLEGSEVPSPSRISVNSDGINISPNNGLQYLNHSCDPNANFRGRELRARKHISLGIEITIDYRLTEPTITHPFTCLCGSPNCARSIK